MNYEPIKALVYNLKSMMTVKVVFKVLLMHYNKL